MRRRRKEAVAARSSNGVSKAEPANPLLGSGELWGPTEQIRDCGAEHVNQSFARLRERREATYNSMLTREIYVQSERRSAILHHIIVVSHLLHITATLFHRSSLPR